MWSGPKTIRSPRVSKTGAGTSGTPLINAKTTLLIPLQCLLVHGDGAWRVFYPRQRSKNISFHVSAEELNVSPSSIAKSIRPSASVLLDLLSAKTLIF